MKNTRLSVIKKKNTIIPALELTMAKGNEHSPSCQALEDGSEYLLGKPEILLGSSFDSKSNSSAFKSFMMLAGPPLAF